MGEWIGEQTGEQEQHDLCSPTWTTEAVMDLTRRSKDKLSRLNLSCPKLSRWSDLNIIIIARVLKVLYNNRRRDNIQNQSNQR